MITSVSSWEGSRDGTRIWSQRGLTILICLVTSDEKNKNKIAQRYLKAENLNSTFFFFANSSWNHLSGLAGTLYRAMRFPIVESFSGLCLALSKAGPYLFPSSMETAICIKLKSYLPKGRKGLDRCFGAVELFGMFYKWLLHQ